MCTPPPSRASSEQGETVLAVQGGEIRRAVCKPRCGGVPVRKLPLGTSEEAKLEGNQGMAVEEAANAQKREVGSERRRWPAGGTAGLGCGSWASRSKPTGLGSSWMQELSEKKLWMVAGPRSGQSGVWGEELERPVGCVRERHTGEMRSFSSRIRGVSVTRQELF